MYTPTAKRYRPATQDFGESMAQTSDMEDADINVIMAKYNRTGMMPSLNMQALTGDFSDVGDFREAQERIREANEEFAKVPANLRKRFDNDPQKFIDFVLDDSNETELVKLGLRNKKEATTNGTENRPEGSSTGTSGNAA